MFVDKNKIVESCIDSRATSTGLFVSVLAFFVLLASITANADGLFDFQMKLAKGGNAEAQYKVGEMYETGFGVKKDMVEARKWTTQAADKGNETAGFKLLYWDVEKNGLKGGNKAKVDVLIKKAEDGNPQAQYFVGKMHANGIGVKKDPDKAIDWLNKAAFVGVLEAESELVVVREGKQRQALAARRAEEKKQAQLKAKKEQAKAKAKKEQQAKLEQQRKLKAEQDAKASADAKSAATANKKKADAAALKKADQEEARKAKILAQKQAEARQREAQKQAKLKKQAEEKQRKTQFESDPCSGKSARFLSTCR
jgi:flagellar biosynthesis GTPase FlhF